MDLHLQNLGAATTEQIGSHTLMPKQVREDKNYIFQTNQGFIMSCQVHPIIQEKDGSSVPYCQAPQLSGE